MLKYIHCQSSKNWGFFSLPEMKALEKMFKGEVVNILFPSWYYYNTKNTEKQLGSGGVAPAAVPLGFPEQSTCLKVMSS